MASLAKQGLFFRKNQDRDRKRFPRIEVAADSMRVGKTTAVKELVKGMHKLGIAVEASYEDWQHNPYLKRSYQDPSKAFLNSQKWFIKRKFEQVRDGANKKVFIQDLPPEGDYNYARANFKIGRMSPGDFKNYQDFYLNLPWETIPAPDLLIYLKASDQVLLERARKSLREFETVDGEYFLALKRVNRVWLNLINIKWMVLEVDTNKLNFAEKIDHQNTFFEMVLGKLRLDGWAV